MYAPEIMAIAIKNQGRTIPIKITAPKILENVEKNILNESEKWLNVGELIDR